MAASDVVSDIAVTHFNHMEVPGPSMEAAAAAAATDSPSPPSSKKRRRRGTQSATSRKRNLTWTHMESQVLVKETLPCWMQLCGPRSRETAPEWKCEKWEEISKKIETMYRHLRDPTACRKKFCDIKRSIARKRRHSERRGKQVPLLPHEAELLAGIGEDEITQLLAHQDRIKAQRRQKRRAEEQKSSTSSSCSVIQSEGEAQEEEAEAATPTSAEAEQEVEEICPVEAAGDAQDGVQQPDASDPGSEVFILNLHPGDEGLDLHASGSAHHPSSPAVFPAHDLPHPSASVSPHLDIPIGAGASSLMQQTAPGHAHSPEPCEYLQRIVECQERHYRRLSHSLALHNRRQMRQYVALKRYQRATRKMICDQLAGMNMSLQRLVTRLEGNQSS